MLRHSKVEQQEVEEVGNEEDRTEDERIHSRIDDELEVGVDTLQGGGGDEHKDLVVGDVPFRGDNEPAPFRHEVVEHEGGAHDEAAVAGESGRKEISTWFNNNNNDEQLTEICLCANF